LDAFVIWLYTHVAPNGALNCPPYLSAFQQS
jgi:hypothetical protein